jgi:hypothetical protein
MPALEELTSAVEAETSVERSVETLLTGLWDHLKEALSSGNIAAVEQAVNDQMHAAPALNSAVTANTGPVVGQDLPGADTAGGVADDDSVPGGGDDSVAGTGDDSVAGNDGEDSTAGSQA